MSLPAGISMQDIETFADQNPELYRVLSGLGRTLNDLLTYTSLATNAPSRGFPPPAGPRNLSVAAVGSTVIITWINDSSPQTILGYKVFRAAAGTRTSPTSPTFTDGKFMGAVLAAEVCLGTQGSKYKYLDRDFVVADMDQANPSQFSYWVTSFDADGQESAGVPATNSPIYVLPNASGDQSSDVKDAALNKLYNSYFKSKTTTSSIPVVTFTTLLMTTNATNATPIQVTTNAAHGLNTGDDVMIYSVLGNTAANGYWVITKVDATNFTLNGSVGNGAYTGAGVVIPAQGGGKPPGDPAFWQDHHYEPWHGSGTAEYYSNGTVATGEVRLPAPAAGNSAWVEQGSSQLFNPGSRLVFSVYLRMPTPATDMTVSLSMWDDDPALPLVSHSFNSSLLTSTYQRVVLNARPSSGGWGVIYAGFRVTVTTNSGTGHDVYVFKPMVNMGDVPAGWTAQADSEIAATVPFETTPPWGRVTPTLIFRDSSAPYV